MTAIHADSNQLGADDVATIRGLPSEFTVSELHAPSSESRRFARLFEYFTPLLSFGLAIDEQITDSHVQSSLVEVHAQVRMLIERARHEACAAGKTPASVESAAFALVAWFDEIATRHPPWRSHMSPLQAQLFNTFRAGDEFFEHLANLKTADDEVREVYYHALLLGFAGQYYFENDDHGELGRIKETNSRQLPVPPMTLQLLREHRITPQPYLMKGPPGPRYPTRWDALRRSFGAIAIRLRKNDTGNGQPNEQDEQLAKVSATIRRAKHVIADQSSEEADGIPSLYRLPWLLFLGDSHANVRGVLQAAARTSLEPSVPSDEESEAIWRFRFLTSMIAIETGAGVVCEPSEHVERRLWQQALKQLASERERLPLNGIVACVDVGSLLGDAEILEKISARLHRLIDECSDGLQLQLPVYVLITGIEKLPGYAAFRGALPADALTQAIGWRRPEAQASDGNVGAIFDTSFAGMAERLHALRLGMLASERRARVRHGVFEFVQSIGGLQQGLGQFVRLLLEDTFQRKVHWRGLYFVGAPDSDVPGGTFVADLFERLLPADQSLAAFSRRMTAGH